MSEFSAEVTGHRRGSGKPIDVRVTKPDKEVVISVVDVSGKASAVICLDGEQAFDLAKSLAEAADIES
jgi:hypothetical protein